MSHDPSPPINPERANPRDELLPLTYGRSSRWPGRVWRALPYVTIGAFIAIVVTTGPHLYRLSRLAYWRWQCARFSPSPKTVVFDDLSDKPPVPPSADQYADGFAVEAELARRKHSKRVVWYSRRKNLQPFAVIPQCVVNFERALDDQVVASPATEVCGLFCHERISPSGHHRLVVVLGDPEAFQPVLMSAVAYGPVGWSGCHQPNAPRSLNYSGQVFHLRRVFAGQPDPSDPSRFNIEYERADGVHGFLDGQLLDDDRVTLTVRPGPGRPKVGTARTPALTRSKLRMSRRVFPGDPTAIG